MPVNPREEATPLDDFSGFIQRKSNRFISRGNELWSLKNADPIELGSIKKGLGYAQRGSDLTTTTSTSTSSSTTTTSTSTSSSTSTTTSTSTS